jgi:hypothetical protein
MRRLRRVNLMRLAFHFSLILVLCGCDISTTMKAKSLVTEALIDPQSARFENVVSNNGSTCGWVNSKNRMGGFVGAQRFLVKDGFEVFLDSSKNAVENGSMSKWFGEFLSCVEKNEEAKSRNTREVFRNIEQVTKELQE